MARRPSHKKRARHKVEVPEQPAVSEALQRIGRLGRGLSFNTGASRTALFAEEDEDVEEPEEVVEEVTVEAPVVDEKTSEYYKRMSAHLHKVFFAHESSKNLADAAEERELMATAEEEQRAQGDAFFGIDRMLYLRTQDCKRMAQEEALTRRSVVDEIQINQAKNAVAEALDALQRTCRRRRKERRRRQEYINFCLDPTTSVADLVAYRFGSSTAAEADPPILNKRPPFKCGRALAPSTKLPLTERTVPMPLAMPRKKPDPLDPMEKAVEKALRTPAWPQLSLLDRLRTQRPATVALETSFFPCAAQPHSRRFPGSRE